MMIEAMLGAWGQVFSMVLLCDFDFHPSFSGNALGDMHWSDIANGALVMLLMKKIAPCPKIWLVEFSIEINSTVTAMRDAQGNDWSLHELGWGRSTPAGVVIPRDSTIITRWAVELVLMPGVPASLFSPKETFFFTFFYPMSHQVGTIVSD